MKRFTLILATLICALGLASCGKESGISVSVDKFEDYGIYSIGVYAFPAAGTTEEDFDFSSSDTGGFSQGEHCYGYYEYIDGSRRRNYYTVKIPDGIWDGYIFVLIADTHKINDLRLEVNGEEKNLSKVEENSVEALLGMNWNYGYYTRIGEFSSNLKLKVKGSTQVLTYTPQIRIENYDECDKNLRDDLRFKYAVNEDTFSDELTVFEVKEKLEALTLTYLESFKIMMYSASGKSFNTGVIGNFGISQNDYLDSRSEKIITQIYTHHTATNICFNYFALKDILSTD